MITNHADIQQSLAKAQASLDEFGELLHRIDMLFGETPVLEFEEECERITQTLEHLTARAQMHLRRQSRRDEFVDYFDTADSVRTMCHRRRMPRLAEEDAVRKFRPFAGSSLRRFMVRYADLRTPAARVLSYRQLEPAACVKDDIFPHRNKTENQS